MKNRDSKKHTQLAATETFREYTSREPIFRESVNCKIHCTPYINNIICISKVQD